MLTLRRWVLAFEASILPEDSASEKAGRGSKRTKPFEFGELNHEQKTNKTAGTRRTRMLHHA